MSFPEDAIVGSATVMFTVLPEGTPLTVVQWMALVSRTTPILSEAEIPVMEPTVSAVAAAAASAVREVLTRVVSSVALSEDPGPRT